MKKIKIKIKETKIIETTAFKEVTLEEKVKLNIENLAKNLKPIRNLLGLTCEALGNYIGVSKQTLNNLETGKIEKRRNVLTNCQYIALRSIIDIYLKTCNNGVKESVLSLIGEDYINYVPGNWMKEYYTYVTKERK